MRTVNLPHAILLAAVIVRLIFSLGVTRGIQNIAPETEVTDGYHRIAENLLSGHGYREVPEHPPTLKRPPAYVIFLYLVFKVAGVNYVAVQIAQALLGALSCWILYRLARSLHSEELGLVAAGMFAVYPSAVEYSARLYVENLYFPVFLGLAYFLCRAAREGSWRQGLAAGALWGVSILTRGTLLLLPIFLAVVLLLLRRRVPVGRGLLRCSAVAALGAILVVGPWTIRNYTVAREIIPVSTWGWAPFYHGIQVSKRMLAWDDLRKVDKEAEERRHEIVVQRLYAGDRAKAWESPAEYVRHERVARDLVLEEIRSDPLGYLARGVAGVPFAWFQTLGPAKRVVSLILHIPLMVLFVLGVRRWRRQSAEGFAFAAPALLMILFVNLFQAFVFPFVRYMSPAVGLSFLFSGLPLMAWARRVGEAKRPHSGLQRGAHGGGAARSGPRGRSGGREGSRRRR